MEKEFSQWYINIKKNTKPEKHISTLKHIGKQLYTHGIIDEPNDIFNVKSSKELEDLKEIYFNIDEFTLNNKKGRNMWGSAFNNYIEFLKSKD